MAAYKELVERNTNRVGMRTSQFERRIKGTSHTKPLIIEFEKRYKDESIGPVSIPRIFAQKPRSDVFISKLKTFEKDINIKKMSKTRFQLFQKPAQNSFQPTGNKMEAIIPDIFKSK